MKDKIGEIEMVGILRENTIPLIKEAKNECWLSRIEAWCIWIGVAAEMEMSKKHHMEIWEKEGNDS